MSREVVRTLLVDDARSEFFIFERILLRFPAGPSYALDWAGCYADALAAIEQDRYDLYFVDIRLGPDSGLELIRHARRRGMLKPIIMLTGHGSEAVDKAATEAGANDYLVKGAFDAALLERTIRYATRNAQVSAELAQRLAESEAIARELELQTGRRAIVEAELRRLTADLEARVRDEVAARKAAQERAAHAERMQVLGQLAGGIAHDFNNVLQSVAGAAELIEFRSGDTASVRRLARLLLEAAERGGSITRRLLAFGRGSNLQAEAVDAVALFGGLQEVLNHTLGGAIGVHVRLAPGLPPLLADKGQLETALVNLATNARDAMPQGGTLTLAAAAETVPAGSGDHPVGLAPGRYVRLAVADTGTGMDATTRARAEEPFFTTKAPGVGTGLGLPMVRGFAEQSGGALAIETSLGTGTTVTLWLPQAEAAGCAAAAALHAAADAAAASGPRDAPTARVLVVDDNTLVREVMAESLEEAGYAVLTAATGAEAVSLLAAGETVDALVTDLSMPGMDGLALIREAQKRRPGLPAVLLTGYAGDNAALAVSGAVNGSFSLLRKPVSRAHLLDRIAALLELQPGDR